MKNYILFKKVNQGYSNIESLEVLNYGSKDEMINKICTYNEWCANIENEAEFLELFEGIIYDAGYDKCSDYLKILWLKLKLGHEFEGEGLYNYGDTIAFQGESFTNDLSNYYVADEFELDELELGTLLNSVYKDTFERTIVEFYGVSQGDGVTEIEARVYDHRHSGYTLDATEYFYNGTFFEEYPEIEEETE